MEVGQLILISNDKITVKKTEAGTTMYSFKGVRIATVKAPKKKGGKKHG